MWILGIDTSGTAGSVALCREGTLLAERSLSQAGRRHAQTLIAEIDEMIRQHGLRPADLNAIGAIRGPGSFTGLRVGLACAKTLSYALRIPLLTVDTFEAIAAQCPPELSDVWIADDAQRQELYVGQYQRMDSQGWKLVGERTIVPIHDWLAKLTTSDVVLGPGTARIPAEIATPRILRDPAFRQPSAGTVCLLAAQKLAAGELDDCWTAMPFYIRVSGAEEKAAKPAVGDGGTI